MVVRTVVEVLTLEETIELILKHTEHQRDEVLKMIEEKRQELGPEVVNEESAAMIIARELGIDLRQVSAKARIRIEDITESTGRAPLTSVVLKGIITSVKSLSSLVSPHLANADFAKLIPNALVVSKSAYMSKIECPKLIFFTSASGLPVS